VTHGRAKAERISTANTRSAAPTRHDGGDIAADCKQLEEVDCAWRDMKSVLDLRPISHRLEEHIRAHVVMRWLALLPIRVAEYQTMHTWSAMRRAFQRISIRTFTGPAGTIWQRIGIPETARDLTSLYISAPDKIHDIGLLCRAWRVCYRPEQVAAALDDSSPVRRQYPA
jgi:hypothetical protein